MPSRPSGTTTFLFTDIEGSTTLLQRLGDRRYADVLAAHHRLLRTAAEEHGGHEPMPTKVPHGIIPALEQALSLHKLRDAEPAARFAEHARDIILRAAPRRDRPEIKWDVNEIRRAAKVVGFLLQAALAVFP